MPPVQCPQEKGMVCPDETVMTRKTVPSPVDPGLARGHSAWRFLKFPGARHQPVRRTCGMFGLPALNQIGFAVIRPVKWRNAVESSFAVAPRP